jgi:hypothetical protein
MKPSRVLSITAFCAAIFCAGCGDQKDLGRDEALERRIIDHLVGLKKNPQPVPLADVVGAGIERVCLQYPYMSESDFESKVGRSISGFKGISDDRYVWWLFDGAGRSRKVQVMTATEMVHGHSEGACFDTADRVMEIDLVGGPLRYSFRRK